MSSIQKHTTRGFTLIELLVVVAIIGILSAMVMVNLQDARERARDAQRKADLKQIQNALEMFKNDKNPQHYPKQEENDIEDGGSDWKVAITSGEYMKAVPGDPTHKQIDSWPDYSYDRTEVLKYTLSTCLENTADQDRDTNNTCLNGASYTLTEP